MGCSHCDLHQIFICKREEQRETQSEWLKLMSPLSRHTHGFNQLLASSLPIPMRAWQIPALSLSVGRMEVGWSEQGELMYPCPCPSTLQCSHRVHGQDGFECWAVHLHISPSGNILWQWRFWKFPNSAYTLWTIFFTHLRGFFKATPIRLALWKHWLFQARMFLRGRS